MFIPLSLLVQTETRLETTEDVVLALDRWVLPNYPTLSTDNVTFTKAECMGVLHSFQSAGKLHYRLRPDEVELAVDAFLEDRFWLDTEVVRNAELLPNQKPQSWMIQPSLLKCILLVPKVFKEAFEVIYSLFQVGVMSVVYKFSKKRPFELPKCSAKLGPDNLTKKDN